MVDSIIEKHMAEMSAAQYQAIGRVAAFWSRLEADIATLLWWLADVQFGPGACLTAQIPNVSRLLDALKALLLLRRGSDDLIRKVNKFSERTHGLVEKRNRVVHDVWMFDPDGPSRHEIRAKGRLVWEYKSEPAATVHAVANEIARHTSEFYEIARQIDREQLMPSRRKPPAKPPAPRRRQGTAKTSRGTPRTPPRSSRE